MYLVGAADFPLRQILLSMRTFLWDGSCCRCGPSSGTAPARIFSPSVLNGSFSAPLGANTAYFELNGARIAPLSTFGRYTHLFNDHLFFVQKTFSFRSVLVGSFENVYNGSMFIAYPTLSSMASISSHRAQIRRFLNPMALE